MGPGPESSSGARRRLAPGDATADGAIQPADAVVTLEHLFAGGPAPSCLAAADSNSDGRLGISDAIYTLGFLFRGGPPPGPPFPSCGPAEPPLAPDCARFPPCEG